MFNTLDFSIPPIQDFTYGQLRSLTGGLCLDSLNGFAGQPVEMMSCKIDNDLRSGQVRIFIHNPVVIYSMLNTKYSLMHFLC